MTTPRSAWLIFSFPEATARTGSVSPGVAFVVGLEAAVDATRREAARRRRDESRPVVEPPVVVEDDECAAVSAEAIAMGDVAHAQPLAFPQVTSLVVIGISAACGQRGRCEYTCRSS